MNRLPILAAAFTLGAALTQSALADGSTGALIAPSQALQSSDLAPNGPVTRAQVKAEARMAEQSYAIPRGQTQSFRFEVARPSTLSRADVKAATRVALRQGLIPRGEAAFPAAELPASTLSRATVKAETRLAEQRGEIPRGEADPSRF